MLLHSILVSLITTLPSVSDDEARTVKELRRDYDKTEEIDGRILILTELASLGIEDPKQAKTAWQGVGIGLKDESYSIRREAIRLLKLCPEREPAVKCLSEALDTAVADAGTGLGRGGRGGRGNAGGRGRGGGGGGEGEGGNEAGGGGASAWAQYREALEERGAYVEDLLGALGELPDDRSVRSVSKFHERAEGRIWGRYRLPAAKALGMLGTRGAMDTVHSSLADAMKQAKADKEREEKAKKAGQEEEQGGRGGRGGREGREGRQGSSAAEQSQQLHDILSAAAKKLELEDVPVFDDKVDRSWKKFLSKNRSSYPSKLGKIEPIGKDAR